MIGFIQKISASHLVFPHSSRSPQATIAKVSQSKFIKKVKEVDTNRDYSILVDTSGSMAGQRWDDVCCISFGCFCQCAIVAFWGLDRQFVCLVLCDVHVCACW